MKKTLLIAALLCAFGASAQDDVITLDLSSANLTFDETTGAWSDTYNDDVTELTAGIFSFTHSAWSEYKTWWGFTASNSADNSPRTDYLTYQFSNMAKGGVDGTDKPYMVGYYSAYNGPKSCSMVFSDGKLYEPQSVYLNLNSYTFYDLVMGDGYARAFVNDDKLTMTITGVAADETEKSVEVTLGSCENGMLSASRAWTLVDLTSLGAVNQLYFSMNSTDTGSWGPNTPLYFCLDKLSVKASESSIKEVAARSLNYDRQSLTVSGAGEFSAVYDSKGQQVLSSFEPAFSLAGLQGGVYVVRSGAESLKVIR